MTDTDQPEHTSAEPADMPPRPESWVGSPLQLWGRAWLSAVTAVAAALVLGIGTLWLIRMVGRTIGMFVLGVAFASSIGPVVVRLERRVPRAFAIAIVYLCLLLFIGFIGWLIVPALILQGQQFASIAPQWVDQAQKAIANLNLADQSNLVDALTTQLGAVGASLVSLPLEFFSSLFELVVVLFISIYWMSLVPHLKQFILSLLPHGARPRANMIFKEMGSAMGGYLRGSAINGLIIGVTTTIGLSIMGVNFPLVLGLLAGVLEVIPVLGPIIAGSVVVVVALLQSFNLALVSLAFVVILQQVENHLLVPNVMRTQTDMPALLVMLALLAGSSLGGLLGALIAIPIAGVLRVLVKDLLAPALRRLTGADETAPD